MDMDAEAGLTFRLGEHMYTTAERLVELVNKDPGITTSQLRKRLGVGGEYIRKVASELGIQRISNPWSLAGKAPAARYYPKGWKDGLSLTKAVQAPSPAKVPPTTIESPPPAMRVRKQPSKRASPRNLKKIQFVIENNNGVTVEQIVKQTGLHSSTVHTALRYQLDYPFVLYKKNPSAKARAPRVYFPENHPAMAAMRGPKGRSKDEGTSRPFAPLIEELVNNHPGISQSAICHKLHISRGWLKVMADELELEVHGAKYDGKGRNNTYYPKGWNERQVAPSIPGPTPTVAEVRVKVLAILKAEAALMTSREIRDRSGYTTPFIMQRVGDALSHFRQAGIVKREGKPHTAGVWSLVSDRAEPVVRTEPVRKEVVMPEPMPEKAPQKNESVMVTLALVMETQRLITKLWNSGRPDLAIMAMGIATKLAEGVDL